MLIRTAHRICVFLLLVFGAGAANAGPAEDELRRFVNDARTVTARFTQIQVNERGEKISTSSGRMILSRPGRFRWAYEQPYEQLMICDGAKIWLYDPDLAQVTVRPAAETLSGTPAALLAQKASLTDQFVVEDLGMRREAQGVKLKPRSTDGDFSSIEMWLRKGSPERMVFFDQLGNRTEIGFSDVQVNGKVDEAQLRFTPPKGTEIVDGESQR